jgi:DnaJ domain
MVLAVAGLALALLAFYARSWLGPRPQVRLAAAALAAAAAGGAVYDGLRGAWLGAMLLIGAALWIGGPSARPAPRGAMSRAEAAAMLGVGEAATRGEIEAAYRRLIRRVHPDLGGASGLAQQINAAREALLKR